MNSTIYEEIINSHNDDTSQIDVLTTKADRILVEAPAGYGKTNTLISKLKIWLLDRNYNKNKKILCLTFSVNAAQNISEKIQQHLDYNYTNLIKVGNYHSISISILRKYGQLLNINLHNNESLKIVGDNHWEIKEILNEEDLAFYDSFNNDKKLGKNLEDKYERFNKIILEEFLPNDFITYDSTITLVVELFDNFSEIKLFYNKYFTHIAIDEFQDTNVLHYSLIKRLIDEEDKLIFLGDSLQRVYGFIGAIPEIMNISIKDFNLVYYKLENNYRFEKDNLKILDTNIRENIKSFGNPQIEKNADIMTIKAYDTVDQSLKIEKIVEDLLKEHPQKKIAILFRYRSHNTQLIKQNFTFDYFDGLYNDEYFEFYQNICNEHFSSCNYIYPFKKREVNEFVEKVSALYKEKTDVEPHSSYTKLLKAFLNNVTSNKKNLDFRNNIIVDTFINNHLKNYLDDIDDTVTVTTIHSSKGSEWDMVILPDLIQGVFPNYYFVDNNPSKQDEIDELCVFYVGITRAKSDLIFSYADSYKIYSIKNNREYNFDGEINDFLKLPGINLVYV